VEFDDDDGGGGVSSPRAVGAAAKREGDAREEWLRGAEGLRELGEEGQSAKSIDAQRKACAKAGVPSFDAENRP
jgi:hypothetical protein